MDDGNRILQVCSFCVWSKVLKQKYKQLTCKMSRAEVCKYEDQQSHGSHFHAICTGCALDSIYCLQMFRPEIPVLVTKWCQMNRFQNLENKSSWVLSFFCFPVKAQELVNLPNAYLTLACHSKLLSFYQSSKKTGISMDTSHLLLCLPQGSCTHCLFSYLFPVYCLLFLAPAGLPKHSGNSITLVLKVGKKLTGTRKSALQ